MLAKTRIVTQKIWLNGKKNAFSWENAAVKGLTVSQTVPHENTTHKLIRIATKWNFIYKCES